MVLPDMSLNSARYPVYTKSQKLSARRCGAARVVSPSIFYPVSVAVVVSVWFMPRKIYVQ